MNYDEALKRWGLNRLRAYHSGPGAYSVPEGDWENVNVEMEFDEGYACCGGRDPNCYCSYAESPSANVVIKHEPTGASVSISHWEFDFASILREIVEAANGTVTLPE